MDHAAHFYDIAAYYFPNYHRDPRNELGKGAEWTEWEDVKIARPRFPGHQQPKVPLWGYQDESQPEVMAQKIAVAADHGVTTFIFDWYWDEEGPFLQRALEHGFLHADNNARLKFSLMWANHWPVSRPTFDRATDHIIQTYFAHPSYQKIDGGIYFSVYQLITLIDGLGGVEQTRHALDHFRREAKGRTGYDVHLNAVLWGLQLGSPKRSIDEQNDLLATLSFDSTTSYVWVHHTAMPHFPDTRYPEYAETAIMKWDNFTHHYQLPYYPNVTVGWDPTPRIGQAQPFENAGYPDTPVLIDNTPEEFTRVLKQAKVFLDRELASYPMLTIYAWNEWAEGGYLEPDTVHGMGYLDAIKRVFGSDT